MSFNVMSLISGLAVDGNGLDLFTMQSAKYEQITTKFTLTVKGVSAGPGVRKLDKEAFRLKTGLHQATLSLAESVTGPQVQRTWCTISALNSQTLGNVALCCRTLSWSC